MKLLTFVAFVVAALLISTAPAAAANRVVDDDGEATPSNCDAAADTPYTTVSQAVADASPGDKIVVCPGIYNEQVIISFNLTLSGRGDATLKPSPMVANSTSLSSGLDIAAVILVEDTATNVVIEQLTIDGSGNSPSSGCGDPNPIGIYYRNGSGSVKNVAVRHMKLSNPAHHGCQVGLGIFAQSNSAGTSQLTVTGSSVHDYQKNGITGNGENTTLTATNNSVSGWGATPSIAQNGIQIGFGAAGTIKENRIVDHFYSQCSVITDPACANGSSSGVIVYAAADGVLVNGNVVGTSQTGVFLGGDGVSTFTNSGTVSSNKIQNTIVYDGVAIIGDTNSVISNYLTDSDEAGIFVLGLSNIIQKNTVNESPVGVMRSDASNLVPTSGNTKNLFYNVGTVVEDFVAASDAGPASASPAVSPVR
jgi:hypothetical protein